MESLDQIIVAVAEHLVDWHPVMTADAPWGWLGPTSMRISCALNSGQVLVIKGLFPPGPGGARRSATGWRIGRGHPSIQVPAGRPPWEIADAITDRLLPRYRPLFFAALQARADEQTLAQRIDNTLRDLGEAFGRPPENKEVFVPRHPGWLRLTVRAPDRIQVKLDLTRAQAHRLADRMDEIFEKNDLDR